MPTSPAQPPDIFDRALNRASVLAAPSTYCVMVGLPFLISWITTQFTNYGDRVHAGLMPVAAQVVPIFALASFMENRAILSQIASREGVTTELRRRSATIFLTSMSLIAVGEGAALYGVAFDKHGTFLTTLVLATLLEAMIDVAFSARVAVGIGLRTFGEENRHLRDKFTEKAERIARRKEEEARRAREKADLLRMPQDER